MSAEVAATAVTYDDLARRVVNELAQRDGLKGLAEDRPFLDFLTELLKELLPVLIGCFGVSAAAKQLKSPGPLVRVRLKMQVNRALRDDDSIGLLARPLFDAILKVARETTEADVQALTAA